MNNLCAPLQPVYRVSLESCILSLVLTKPFFLFQLKHQQPLIIPSNQRSKVLNFDVTAGFTCSRLVGPCFYDLLQYHFIGVITEQLHTVTSPSQRKYSQIEQQHDDYGFMIK